MRRFRLRRPIPYWLLAAALAALTTLLVAGLVGRAEAAVSRWGVLRPVVVATSDVAAGEEIASGDLAVEERPASLLPAGALEESPVGRVATAAITAGEVVVRSRVAPGGVGRLAALLPPGGRGMAIPLDRTPMALAVGDVVDLLATFDPRVAGDGDPTFPVARGAVVIDVGEDAVTVAVGESEAPPVAFALANGIVTLALRR